MTTASSAPIDVAWLEDVLIWLLRTPTSVPPGKTIVEPGDPDLLAAVHDVVVPLVEDLHPDEVRRHPLGEVAARFGPPGDRGLLVQVYLVSQHGNLMEDPLSGTIIGDGTPGKGSRIAFGQGASQNKGPMAAVLTALRHLPRDLSRPVWLAVNTEGRSSHGGSRRIIDDLGVRAAHGIVSIGTDLQVSVGNRGRVDVHVTVKGQSCHSSQPWLGSNPIEGASDVVAALRTLPLPPPHPELGPASATPYVFECHPVAPHTIPDEVRMVVDRRMMPEEDHDTVVGTIRTHLEAGVDASLDITLGDFMLPAVVDPTAPVVELLRHHVHVQTGRDDPPLWSKNTFDAGLACSRGIPTCMFGPGKRSFDAGVTAAESVAVSDCVAAAAALHATFLEFCLDSDTPHASIE